MVSETLPMLQECYAHLPEQQHNWAEFLKRCVEENTGATADLMLAEIIEQHEGRDVVQVYINRQLQRHPTMRVFYRLMDYHLADAEDGRAKESLLLLRDMVGEQIRTKPRYRCHKCGFTAHSLYWHCPSCRAGHRLNRSAAGWPITPRHQNKTGRFIAPFLCLTRPE